MSYKTVCICDVCGRQKGEANHWMLFSKYNAPGFLAFAPWNESIAGSYDHICSEECAHKLLATFLSPAPKAVPEKHDEA